MVTSSYPRFPGDGIGTFIEPIAHGVANLGHEVHIVAPWHPLINRQPREGNVFFHFFRYAPLESLHSFGYATSLKEDVALRPTAYLAAPLALSSGWLTVRRVVQHTKASILHAHWVVPGGVIAALSMTGTPLVVSLHGSDVFLSEKNRMVRLAAKFAFDRADWITSCSEDLRQRAITLGSNSLQTEVIPYGVDADRFQPNQVVRERVRHSHGIAKNDLVLVAIGRLVRKKGFEFLIDALVELTDRWPRLRLFLIGQGDLEDSLRQQAISKDISEHVVFLGALTQNQVADWLAAADISIVPSIKDDAGNVDGLPNVLLESLASGTPVVTTKAGGIGSVAKDGLTACLAPEKDASGLASSIGQLLEQPAFAADLGQAARELMIREHAWTRVARRLTEVYARAAEIHHNHQSKG
jgi:glycosyltransferase involved in cell wall biosynthesis